MHEEPQAEKWGQPGSPRRRALFLAVCGILLLATLIVFRAVLLPFILAIVVAYVLAPLVGALERTSVRGWRPPRWSAVLFLYVLLVGALVGIVSTSAPRLAAELGKLAHEAPRVLRTAREAWLPKMERVIDRTMSPYLPFAGPSSPTTGAKRSPSSPGSETPDVDDRSIRVVLSKETGGYAVYLPPQGLAVSPHGQHGYRIHVASSQKNQRRDLTAAVTDALSRAMANTEGYAVTALRTGRAVVKALVSGVFTFVITLMLSAYLLITRDRIFAFFRSLVRPEKQRRFDDLLRRMDRGLAGVIRGQLVICVVNGVLSGIGFYWAGLKYWPILTLLAGALSVIPIFGAIISSVPAMIVALQNGIGVAVFVLAWTIGIHQLEANVLNPKILGDAAKVHPVLVVFALLAGEHLFGIVGALLAVPVLSITQTVFLHYREVALGVPASNSIVPQPPANP